MFAKNMLGVPQEPEQRDLVSPWPEELLNQNQSIPDPNNIKKSKKTQINNIGSPVNGIDTQNTTLMEQS